jgi:hypothetical protein
MGIAPTRKISEKPCGILSGTFLLSGGNPIFVTNSGSMTVKEGLQEVAVRLRELPVTCVVTEKGGKRQVSSLYFDGVTPALHR